MKIGRKQTYELQILVLFSKEGMLNQPFFLSEILQQLSITFAFALLENNILGLPVLQTYGKTIDTKHEKYSL